MHSLLPEALFHQGKALLDLNQNSAARDRLLEAQTIALAIGSRRTLWRILFALSHTEEHPETARRLLQEAQRVLNFILAHFWEQHSNLRETFLKQADVQAEM